MVSIFLKFSPLFGEDFPFDEHIFRMGWFNHQVGIVFANAIPAMYGIFTLHLVDFYGFHVYVNMPVPWIRNGNASVIQLFQFSKPMLLADFALRRRVLLQHMAPRWWWKVSAGRILSTWNPLMTSIFEGQPPKTRPFPIKTRVIWVPGRN